MIRTLLQRLKYPSLTFLLSTVILFYFFHTILLAPNDYMFTAHGDGAMNYYSYMFQATYESGDFWNFKGMNYPYYEHVVYTGAHPLQAFVVNKLGLAEYGVGILNLMMLLSYPIASVFLFLILRHYKVSILWSIVAALMITYLTPQLGRMTGHFALSYVFAIPAMWWLLLKCRHGHGPLWAIISFLYLFVFFMTHPYLGMILVMFCLLFWTVAYLYNRSSWKTSAGFIAMQVVLPIVLFRILMFITDTHVDRIDEPAGFFQLHAGWSSILAAHHGPMSFLPRAIHMNMLTWESWAYLGLSTILFFVYAVTYLFSKRKKLPLNRIFRHELFMFFIAAYAILIFSFCFPFKLSFMRWMADSFGPLKQFRVLGRFTWIFYYVFTTGIIVALYQIYLAEKKRTLIVLFFFGGMAFSFMETHQATKEVANVISAQHNSFKHEHLDPDMQDLVRYVQVNEYDAFIFLPFFHLSSENIMIIGEEQASFDAYMLSYHTELPMMNCLASRMSQSESVRFNNFFGREFVEKELTYDLPVNDKIALITNQDFLNHNELRMTYTQKVAYQNETFTVYLFDREAWNTNYYFDEVKEKRNLSSYKLTEEWWSSDPEVWFVYESWDGMLTESFKGRGALQGIKKGHELIWEADADDLMPGEYEVSYWYNHGIDRADLMTITELYYKDKDEPEWVDDYEFKEGNEIVGQWMRAEMNFIIDENVDSVKVFLLGNNSRKPFAVDELLVRRTDGPDLFSKSIIGSEKYIIYNNFWLRENSFKPK